MIIKIIGEAIFEGVDISDSNQGYGVTISLYWAVANNSRQDICVLMLNNKLGLWWG